MQNPDDLIARARKYLVTLPDSIEGQQGHAALYRAATVLAHGFAFDEATALDLLREYNVARSSPPWDEKALERKIREANNRTHTKPRGYLLGDSPAQTTNRPLKTPQKPAEAPKKATLANLPAVEAIAFKPSDTLTILDFFAACFNPDDQVQVETPAELNADGKGRPTGKGIVKTVAAWQESVDLDPALYGGPAGAFVRINPVKDAEGKDTSVSAFRHVLLEWDTGEKQEQLARIYRSNLPVSAIVDSGGKSVHAWVRVDAADRAEYDARVGQVYDLFADCPPDKQNKNPSRFTRLPFAKRGNALQALIKTCVGFADWATWSDWKAELDAIEQEKADGTEQFDLEALDAFDPKADPTVLVGKDRRWLCKGYVLQIVGFSGSGKSSLAMQMCVQWARGLDLFGLQPVRPLRIVICQSENDFGDTAEALADDVIFLQPVILDELRHHLRVRLHRMARHVSGRGMETRQESLDDGNLGVLGERFAKPAPLIIPRDAMEIDQDRLTEAGMEFDLSLFLLLAVDPVQVSPDRDLAVSLDHLVSDEVVSVDLDRRTRCEPFNGTEERELRGKN